MGSVSRFEDLKVWKEGMRLASSVYERLQTVTDFGLRNQMQRAAVSIPSNIAEGYERGSNKEFIRFLNIAKGSCAELRTQLYLAKKLGILPERDDLIDTTKEISAMLSGLIQTRKNKF